MKVARPFAICAVAATTALVVVALPEGAHAVDYDCSDFSNQAAAQEFFVGAGGSASNNVDDLDADHDGVACESLPCPCSTGSPAPVEPPPSPPPVAPAPVTPPAVTPPPSPAPEPEEEPERPRSRVRPTYWRSAGGPPKIEPVEIQVSTGTLSGTFTISALRSWHGWTTGRASARGYARVSSCQKNCAAGNYKRLRVEVVLTKPRGVCGQRRYVDIRVHFLDPRQPTFGPFGTNCKGPQDRRP